jgi:hypothetical protein
MNIAFPALLIFLLVLPGLIFNFAFYKIENTALTYIPFTNKTTIGAIVTLILHTLGLSALIYIFKTPLDLHSWFILISGVQNDKYSAVIDSLTPHQLIAWAAYLLVICFIAYSFGKLLRFLISHYEWDRHPFFEIDSSWYYLFKGYGWKDGADGTPDFAQIAAIIEIAGKGYLYSGFLEKFFLDKEGNIDRLVITGARRREISKDKTPSGDEKDDNFQRFYPIDGDYFVLRYSEIKNLNVQFLKLDEIRK